MEGERGDGMSEWTKEELEEFWRWPTAFGSLLGGKDTSFVEDMERKERKR